MRTLLSVAIGAGLGFAWYRTVGCSTGSCPITSTWWTSTLYGAVMGALAGAGPS
jgi:hypothetical protein